MRGIRVGARPRVAGGLIPWAIAAVVVLGVGIAGTVFADNWSRQVDVTVETADGHGHCRVSWTDPWSHQVRHGPMACPLDEWDHPLQPGDVATEAVADWPWRGQRYDDYSTDGPAFTAAAWVAFSGAVMLVGVVAIAVFRRIPRRFLRVEASAGEQVLARARAERSAAHSATAAEAYAEPTYANLVTAAQAQWASAGWDADKLPRDRDVREVPWWRVRALRATSTSLYAFGVCYVVAICTGPGLSGHGSTIRSLWPIGLTFALGALLVHLAYEERRTAITLARAARSPFTDTRRYVAVWESRRGSLWMMLFPPDCGDGDLPEAILPLLAERKTRRRYGFPAAPVGETELHSDPARPQTIVPWSEGRPVWPCGELVTVDPDDSELMDFLRHFTSPSAGPRSSRGRRGALTLRRSTRHSVPTPPAGDHRH